MDATGGVVPADDDPGTVVRMRPDDRRPLQEGDLETREEYLYHLLDRCRATGDDDAAEVAAMTDAGPVEGGLPEHEDDSRRAEDTGTGELNP